jgi:hypothetical protein
VVGSWFEGEMVVKESGFGLEKEPGYQVELVNPKNDQGYCCWVDSEIEKSGGSLMRE